MSSLTRRMCLKPSCSNSTRTLGSFEPTGEKRIIPSQSQRPEKLLIGPPAEGRGMGAVGGGGGEVGLPAARDHRFGFYNAGDGTAFWDKAGQVTANDPPTIPSLSLAAWELSERKAGDKSTTTGEIKALLKKKPAELTPRGDPSSFGAIFLTAVYANPGKCNCLLRTEIKTARDRRSGIDKQIVSTLISRELEKRRPTYVLIRGEYDKHGEAVGPGDCRVLPGLPPSEKTNRLTLPNGRWIPKRPLTARVTVNRFWQQVFGTGLVKTAEDFGTKGEWPSHPELLDWLATEFMSNGWDVKALMKLMVTSATYRQDSRVTGNCWMSIRRTGCWRGVRGIGWMLKFCGITPCSSAGSST